MLRGGAPPPEGGFDPSGPGGMPFGAEGFPFSSMGGGGGPGGARTFHFSTGGGGGGFNFSDAGSIFSEFMRAQGGGMGGGRGMGGGMGGPDDDLAGIFGGGGGFGGMGGGMGGRPGAGRSASSRFGEGLNDGAGRRHATPEVTVLEKPLPVSLEELYNGTTKKMKIKRKTYDQATGKQSTQDRILEVPIKKGLKAGSKIKFSDVGDQVEGGTQDLHFVVQEVRIGTVAYETAKCRVSETNTFDRKNTPTSSATATTSAQPWILTSKKRSRAGSAPCRPSTASRSTSAAADPRVRHG